MRNRHLWKPTKFVCGKKGLRANKNRQYIKPHSWLIADIIARYYENMITTYAGGHLLDLGCGYVPLYHVYKDLVSDIVCIDWNKSEHNGFYHDHEMDLNKEIELKSSDFDTILLVDVLEHIARPDVLWQEMARLLKPGGKLILGVPFLYWLHEEPHDSYRYTRFSLTNYCEQHGLDVLILKPYGGSLEVFLDLMAKHLGFSLLLSKIHFYFGKLLVDSFIGHKIYQLTCEKFPLGYILVAQKRKNKLL